MKAATINELKQELEHLSAAQLKELCLRLAKFKKENKELLTYLLFEAHDAEGYVRSVKEEMDGSFPDVNTRQVYLAKKTLRKILRIVDKYSRYAGLPEVEAELRIHFCREMKALELPIQKNPVLLNMYQNQLKKIDKAIASLHEDLQYDLQKEVETLALPESKNWPGRKPGRG